MTPDPRLDLVRQWLTDDLDLGKIGLSVASADASFRRYFRVRLPDGGTRIVMDAPPQHEDLAGYLRISSLLEKCGVHVPHVHAHDTVRGVALLEDLGSTHMLTALQEGADPVALYAAALDELAALQLRGDGASLQLPPYDRAVLLREMRLLPEWFCGRHLGWEPGAADTALLDETFDFLVAECARQPLVFVHRDYHSRNLMIVPERSPGVIDFQDALRGPVGYDLVSILKDCYVAWPRDRVEQWVAQFRDRLRDGGAAGVALAGESFDVFLRWFDLIGLQRHIKVLGIFARLNWRDGKSGYLADLPRTLSYVREVASRYPELASFSTFVEQRLVPELPSANERAMARVTA
jgi:aminoglycoside/choline kinase family phosphotransferase